MTTIRRIGPYALVAIGATIVLGSLVRPSLLPTGTTESAVAAGFVVVFAGAFWYDVRSKDLTTSKDYLAYLLNLVGLVALMVVFSQYDLPSTVEGPLAIVGLGLLGGTGYWLRLRDSTETLDERDLRARYRAAKVAADVVIGVLAVGLVATAAVLEPTGVERRPEVAGVLLAAVLPIALAGLVYAVASGYYETRLPA